LLLNGLNCLLLYLFAFLAYFYPFLPIFHDQVWWCGLKQFFLNFLWWCGSKPVFWIFLWWSGSKWKMSVIFFSVGLCKITHLKKRHKVGCDPLPYRAELFFFAFFLFWVTGHTYNIRILGFFLVYFSTYWRLCHLFHSARNFTDRIYEKHILI
jgi:hypothetical protein